MTRPDWHIWVLANSVDTAGGIPGWMAGGIGWHNPWHLGVTLQFNMPPVDGPTYGIVAPADMGPPEPKPFTLTDFVTWYLCSLGQRIGVSQWDPDQKNFRFRIINAPNSTVFDCLLRAKQPADYLAAVFDGMPTSHWTRGRHRLSGGDAPVTEPTKSRAEIKQPTKGGNS